MKYPRNMIRRDYRTGSIPRRGSVLVVVLALLAALMLLGFLFLTLASQERENARYFTAGEKSYAAEADPEKLFDFALEQIILGPRDDLVNSALWGGRYSLLASLVGDDVQPYSGAGVNVVDAGGNTPNGRPAVDERNNATGAPGPDGVNDALGPYTHPSDDLDGDGVRDLLALNVAAWGNEALKPVGDSKWVAVNNFRNNFSQPDVGYTYPDLNSPFLAYIGKEPMTGERVIIPSFHRPQYLRGLFGANTAADWYTAPDTRPYVLRPHGARTVLRYDYNDNRIEDSGLLRFTDNSVVNPPSFNEGFWTWSGSGAPIHELDVDADGDGIKEAVLLDLDYPVEETPDGSQKFVPLFGITLYDLDGLLNLNAHGNLYGESTDLAQNPFGNGQFLSRSNEGRQRSEVNPQYGMRDADPASASAAHRDFFERMGFIGRMPASAVELANLELWFLLAGRADFNAAGGIEQLHPGRWGDSGQLQWALDNGSADAYDYPLPGLRGQDDNGDARRGLRYAASSGEIFPAGMVFDQPVQPEDWQGQGSFVGGDGKTPNLRQIIAGSRVSLLQYLNYWLPAGGNIADAPVWQQVSGTSPVGNLVQLVGFGLRGANGYLIDDPGETLLDSAFARDPNAATRNTFAADNIFSAEETAFLHLDQNTFQANGLFSRLLNLVPANFRDDINAEERRKRYTTVSADLKSYSFSTDRMRTWEVGRNASFPYSQEERLHENVFPPYFGADSLIDPFRPEVRGLLQQEQSVLTANRNDMQSLIRKLSVNHVAAAVRGGDDLPRYLLRPVTPHPTGLAADAVKPDDNDPANGVEALPNNWPTQFGTTNGSTGTTDTKLIAAGRGTNSIAPNSAIQEWHARRDRQNLARDIYTLLYTLGDANATFAANPVTTSNIPAGARPVYSEEQLREMAQFAVNLVDAMDPDDTITAFIYDKNLANGYTLEDDGYTDPPPYVAATGRYEDDERGLVFGVESQKLAITEALVAFAKKVEDGSGNVRDHDATEWDDRKHRDFTYVELRNLTPYPERLDGSWSIVCDPTEVNGNGLPRSLTITKGDSVAPGGLYTTGTAGDAHNTQRGPSKPAFAGTEDTTVPGTYEDLLPSYLFVDPNTAASGGTPDFDLDGDPSTGNAAGEEPIAPFVGTLNFDAMKWIAKVDDSDPTNDVYRVNVYDPTQPQTDGTLETVDSTSDPAVTNGPPAGLWLDLGDQTDRDSVIGTETVKFYLRRRLNLDRAVPDQDATAADDAKQQDNPWIIVDEFEVNLKLFELTGNGNEAEVQAALESIKSDERKEALNRASYSSMPPATNTDPASYRLNRLGDDAATGAYTLWQRHFDRNFASIADVLNVPLYGPKDVTKQLPTDTATNSDAAVANKHQIAGKRILFPEIDGLYSDVTSTDPAAKKNLWYRILEFVEVPSKYGDADGLPWFAHYGGPSPWGPNTQENLRLRDFGKLNLNTMRHPHVLAGLLDDSRVFNFGSGGYLPSANGENRDWWLSMLASRDGGYDAYSGQEIILPGVPAAKPFMGFSPFTNWPTAPGQPPSDFTRTLLRPMPTGTFLRDYEADRGRRSLFELGDYTPPPDSGSLPSNVVGSDAEFATRYRLLGKVLNHGTTRSNTYMCFMTCDFYEANDDQQPGVYQIGAKIPADSANPDEPRYRGVFIIDRTMALEMLKKEHLPTETEYPSNSNYQTYSFARDPVGTSKFEWEQLLLYRKITKAD